MIKLLRADFRRAFKSLIFWSGAVVAFLNGLVAAAYTRSCEYIDDMVIVPFFVMLAVVVSLMIGKEHSYGALRNKIVAGCSKASIYFSNLIVFLSFSFVSALIYLGTFAILMKGHISTFPAYALLVSALEFVLISLAYTVIFVSASMLISRKSVSSVVCIMIVLAMVFGVYMISFALDQLEYYKIGTISPDGTEHFVYEPNPRYIGGTARVILENAVLLMPHGAVIKSMSIVNPCFEKYNITLELPAEELELLKTMPLYTFVLFVIVVLLGWWLFRKKELK